MDTSISVKFTYRTYSRTREGSQLDSIKDQLTKEYPTCAFSEGENVLWPAHPHQIDTLRDRGILLTERGDTMCVVIQELLCLIVIGDHESGVALADSLLHKFPNTFTSVTVETSYFTDVQAV